MTNSAKRDPAKATADEAELESAATNDDGVEASQDAAAETVDDEAPEDDTKPDLDEVKRKFREALDRKHGVQAEGQAKGGRDNGKGVHGAHGPAASRRSFRRKSG